MRSLEIAKWLMKLRETRPESPEKDFGELQEAFRHPYFIGSPPERRRELMLESSQSKFRSENDYAWDHYFGVDLHRYLSGADVLDLGCFNGGRGVAWFERYGFHSLKGVDVSETLIEAAALFARERGVNASYQVAKGEDLAFPDESFDAILTYDVLEHVQDLERTMDECWRVLRPGGRMFLVFPSFYQPLEHHLSLVTHTPAFHYFFSAETLIRAYSEIIEERGPEADWYKRSSPEPYSWERCNTINGTTLREFKPIIRNHDWRVDLFARMPIGSIGRGVRQRRWPKLLAAVSFPFTFVPWVQECVLHRITYILRKA